MLTLTNYLRTIITQDKLTPEKIKKLSEHVWKLHEFIQNMQQLNIDEFEYAYLRLITVFNAGKFFQF